MFLRSLVTVDWLNWTNHLKDLSHFGAQIRNGDYPVSHKFNTLAVDLSSLAYRSYFGLPDSIKSTDGKPVNAIKGYLDALNRFIKMYEPKTIIHATDEDWRPQWRVDLLPQYKAHRVEDETEEIVPDDLDYQLNLLPEILADMGMNVIGIEKAEADDVLATISFNYESVVVITGDRDLLQLIDDQRGIAVHMLGKEGGLLFKEQNVKDKYGVCSQQYIDFSVLRGDASDGLPGVKGVGEKTSAKLIQSLHSLERIIQESNNNNSFMSEKIRNSILESIDYITKARYVVKLKTDLNLNKPGSFQPMALADIRAKYENIKIGNQIDTFYELSKTLS